MRCLSTDKFVGKCGINTQSVIYPQGKKLHVGTDFFKAGFIPGHLQLWNPINVESILKAHHYLLIKIPSEKKVLMTIR